MTREPLVTSLQGKEIFFLCLRNKNQKKNLCLFFFLFKRFQNYSTFFSAFHISCILYKSLSTKSAIILDIKEIWNILLEELPGVSKLVLILARVAHIQLQLCARLKSQDFQLEINIPITLKISPFVENNENSAESKQCLCRLGPAASKSVWKVHVAHHLGNEST